MASRCPPEITMIDPGNVPMFKIDGIAEYELRDGWAFSRYFVEERIPITVAGLIIHQRRRRICLSLVCRDEVQMMMRQAVFDWREEADALKKLS